MIAAAGGTLRMITVSPEIPGAEALIRRFAGAGATVSAGHTGLPPDRLADAVDWGVRHVCHLFDTFDPREVAGGATQPSLVDAMLIEDRLLLEIIPDGIHVPPPLLTLARRAAGADRLVAITDAMQGAGLPDGVYTMADGRRYTLANGDVCRLADDPGTIVGSCLTMNRAFANLVRRFGFTPVEAAKATATNPARALGLAAVTGALRIGLAADIVVLAPDGHVRRCLVDGRERYRA